MTTVWMCRIETNGRNNGWATYRTFLKPTRDQANLMATRIIVKDLWVDSYLDIPADDNDIIDKLCYTVESDFRSNEYVAEFHNDKEFFEDILVTVWEITM